MNANELADELADELEEHSQGPNLTQLGAAWFLEIATMLRQQQAEIEVLKDYKKQYELLNKNVVNKLMEAKAENKVLKEKIKWLEGKDLLGKAQEK